MACLCVSYFGTVALSLARTNSFSWTVYFLSSASVSLSPSSCVIWLFFHLRADVVICLSTTVRNDTLQDVKDQRVSLKCRKQLRVEELEMVNLNHTLHIVQTPFTVLDCHLFDQGPKSTIKVSWKFFISYSCSIVFWSYTFRRHTLCPLHLQSEDIRLEPELHDACKKDINKLCSSVAYGNARVTVYLDLLLF